MQEALEVGNKVDGKQIIYSTFGVNNKKEVCTQSSGVNLALILGIAIPLLIIRKNRYNLVLIIVIIVAVKKPNSSDHQTV